MSKHAQSDLKIDFSNAFNRVDRQVFMQNTAKEFPGLANWTNWCYSQKSILLYDHRELIDSSSGVQQGDPLGPLYFCFALAPFVEEIQALGPLYFGRRRHRRPRSRPSEDLADPPPEGSFLGFAPESSQVINSLWSYRCGMKT